MEWDNNKALERLKKINFPHLSGTPSLIKARDKILEELKAIIPDCSIEEFQFRNELKGVMKFWSPILLSFTVIKALLWIGLFWLSMIVAVLQVLVTLIVEGRIGPQQFVNRFKNQGPISGYNVIGSLKARENEKKVLVLGAHFDTKSLAKITKKGSSIMTKALLINGLLIIILGIIRSIINLFFVVPLLILMFSIAILIGAVIEFFSIAIYTLYHKIINTSPGVNDNGSGVVMVLELASIFSKNPPKNLTLNFALFDAEEIGFQGSSAYVYFHSEKLIQKNAWMVNFDVLAGGFPIKVVTRGGIPVEPHGKELNPLFQKAVQNNSELMKLETDKKLILNGKGLGLHSDHVPFFCANIPAVIIATANKNAHSDQDNWDAIEPESIDVCGNLMIEFIKQLDESL